MKKTLHIKNLVIGEGMPKICVPITGVTEEDILAQARETKAAGPDLVEWRVDFYEHMREADAVEALQQKLSAVLEDIPILFTLRTDREGSSTHVEGAEYAAILRHAACCDGIDLIDVEVMPDPVSAGEIIAYAHQQGKAVIGSNHHFEGTPERATMDAVFTAMENVQADILKMAVMPKENRDVLTMLEATMDWTERSEKPLITMSMGALGCVSRMCGELTGSAVTFASVTEASAPGQIAMSSLKEILTILHNK